MRLARAAIGQSTLASTSTARALPAACSCRARRLLATGSAPTARGVCASCSKPLASALSTHCPACGTIQPCPPSDDRGRAAFELFELGEPRYTIDKRALKRRFLELQRAVHPDANVAQGGEQAGSRAREWSGWVNGAYRALDGDLSRAEYLLALENAAVQEDDKASDPDLLMDILETREALEEASSRAEIEPIRERNRAQMDETIAKLDGAFTSSPVDAERAKALAIRLRYFANVEDVCREWQPGQRVELSH